MKTLWLLLLPLFASAQAPLAHWTFDDGSGTVALDSSGNSYTMNLSGSPAWQPTASCVVNGCVAFNGANQYGMVPLDLSHTKAITIAFWLKWNAYANDNHIALEFTPNFNNVTTGFLILPDEPGGETFMAGFQGNAGYNLVHFTRPSAGVWHHYAFVMNKAASAAAQVIPYVDGQPISYTKPISAANTGYFGNSYLFAMSRDGSSFFGAGSLDELYVYTSALTASEIAALANHKRYGISGNVTGTAATLTLSGGASGTTTTDSSGNYSFGNLSNGTYSVAPSKSGYTFAPTSTAETVNGANITGVNFAGTAVVTTYSISGNVTGSAATLTLSGTSSGQTTTDGAGNYSFGNLINGSYVVAPSETGFTFNRSGASETIGGANIGGVNFAATTNTTHTVTLNWTLSTDPLAGVSGYNLYRSNTSGSSYVLLASVSNTSTSFIDNGVSNGQTYYYVARTVESGVESVNSNQATSGAIP